MFISLRMIRANAVFALLLVVGGSLCFSPVGLRDQHSRLGPNEPDVILASRYPLRQRTPTFYSRSRISYSRSR